MQEAKLRGPHPFPLERLLAICWALLDADTAVSDEAPPLDGVERQSAEAYMQISSLVSLQLLSQARPLTAQRPTCQGIGIVVVLVSVTTLTELSPSMPQATLADAVFAELCVAVARYPGT